MIKPERSERVKKEHQLSMLKAFRSVFKAQNKKFLFASLCLHLVVIILLVFSWSSEKVVKTMTLPSNLHARVLSLDEVKKLESKKQTEEKKILDQKRQKKEEKRLKQKKEKLKLEKRKKDKAKKKAEAKRKKEAAKQKKLKIKKLKKAQEKKAQEKKIRERKKREELAHTRQKEEKEEKERRLESQRLEKEKLEKERHDAEVQSIREKRLLEQMNALEERERVRQDNLLKQQEAQAFELTEIERFKLLIHAKIQSKWHVPPKSAGLSLLLRIRLLPSRELESVVILESSGRSSFDQSAVNAVKSVRLYPVPADAGIFDRNFRQFSMRFTPDS